jgi:tetratricopeptide (TPR) repeat protein
MLAARGRSEEAFAAIRSAERLDPQSPIIRSNVAWTQFLAGRYEQAMEQVRRVLRDHPDFAVAHGYLGQSLLELGRHGEAIASLERAVEISRGGSGYLAELSNAHATAGSPQRAREILTQLEERARERYVSPYTFAMAYAGLGEVERALDWLEAAANEFDPRVINVKVHPRFRHLHGHARFRALLSRMGLDSTARRE